MIEKKSMLCPNCRKLISSDEPACPYCGTSRPGSLWKRGFGGRDLPAPPRSGQGDHRRQRRFLPLFAPAGPGGPRPFGKPHDLPVPFGREPLPPRRDRDLARSQLRPLVDPDFRLVPPRGHPAHLLQHDGLQAARPLRPGGIRLQPLRDPLHLDRHRRLLPLLSGRESPSPSGPPPRSAA